MLTLRLDLRIGGTVSFGEVRLNMTIQRDLIQASDLASGVKARKGRKDLGRPIRKLAQTLAERIAKIFSKVRKGTLLILSEEDNLAVSERLDVSALLT